MTNKNQNVVLGPEPDSLSGENVDSSAPEISTGVAPQNIEASTGLKTKKMPEADPTLESPVDVADTEADDWTPEYHTRHEESAGLQAETELDNAFASENSKDKQAPSVDEQSRSKTEIAKDVAKDVGWGLIEMTPQVIGGMVDAINETSDAVFELSEWLKEINPQGIRPGATKRTENEAKLPTVGEASTTTGAMARGVSQFVSGFVGAGKLIKPIKYLRGSNQVTQAAVKGAISDFTVFDPHEDNLANLIQEFPTLQNPVSEFLSADPTDNAAAGRFKKAVEGLGLGLAVDGFVVGLKALRSSRIMRDLAKAADPSLDTITVAPDLSILGDINSDKLILRKTKKAEQQTKGIEPADVLADPDPDGVFINFARIDSDDDVKNVIKQSVDLMRKNVDSAGRGVRSHEQTKLSAEQQNAWDLLVNRDTGGTFNAEETVAVRNLWVSSAEKLAEVSIRAVANPSISNQYAFRKMMTVHHAIQREVMGARTESARAFNAWKITAKGDVMMARQLEELLAESGGGGVAMNLAKRIAALSEANMHRELSVFVEKGAMAKTGDAVAQAWINGLLSNPTTHVINAMSNWAVIPQQIMERKVAEQISQALGTENGVELGEAAAQMFAVTQGFKEALRVSAKGLEATATAAKLAAQRKGSDAKKVLSDSADEFGGVYKSLATGKTGFGMGKVELPRAGAMSSETWNVAKDTPMGRSLDAIDAATQVPGRLLATADELFKTIGYRMELNAQALREASAEVRSGKISADAMKARIQELIENPSDVVKLRAIDAATYQTFTNSAQNIPTTLANAIRRVPVLGLLTLPFKRTPINLMMYTFERTPFAPLIKTWRTDIAAGGARRDIALARIATGSMIMATAIDLAASGVITGSEPTHPGEKDHFYRQGKKPNSIRLGDEYYSFSKADPIGMTLGIGADMFLIANNAQESDEGWDKILTASTLAIAKNVTSKTYMRNVSRLINAISDRDRYGDSYFEGIAGSIVPAGLAAAARLEDPYMREAGDMVEAIKRRTPWWNQDLPLSRDLWGRPIPFKSDFGTLYDALSPISVSTENSEPIDTELERLEFFPERHSKKISVNGIQLDLEKFPHAYSRYVELAGNELKHPVWGVGLKDLLNEVVSGEHQLSPVYKARILDDTGDGPDGRKAMFIRGKIEEYRELAKEQIMKEFPELQAEYDVNRSKSSKIKHQISSNLTLK